MTESNRLRVAVVGAGIGRSHVAGYKAVSERFDVVAVCDIDAERARPVAEEHGVSRVVTDLGELLRMDDVDVVDLCTPPHLHFEQIQQVLGAGKHAICEKPIVINPWNLDALEELDDVQSVYSNMDVPADVMERISERV